MRTDVRVFEKMGDNSCATASPTGLPVATIQSNEDHCLPGQDFLPMEMIIVAVVRPFKSNHLSEYFGAKIWYTGCGNPESAWGNGVKGKRE